MQKKFFYLLIIITALILQTSAMPALGGSRSGLDLVLMLVLAWAIIDGFAAFLPWAITIGILYDFVTMLPIGVHVLVFLFVVYMISFFSKRLSIDFRATGLLMILFFIAVSFLVSQISIGIAIRGDLLSIKEFWNMISPAKWLMLQLAYNCLAFLFCFIGIRWAKNYFMLEA